MTPTRLLSVLLVAALGAACGRGGDDGGSASSTTGAQRSSTSTTSVAVDYREPGRPESLTFGLVAGASPDGSAFYVFEEDDDFDEPGCEGQPEPVLFLVAVDGGGRERLGTAAEPVRGRLVAGPENRVAVVDECEGFLQQVRVGTQAPDGRLTGLRVVPVEERSASLSQPRISAWSRDGDALLAGGASEATGDGLVAEVDVATGAIRPLFGTGSGAGPGQVDQLADGTFVVAADGEVTVRDEDGGVRRRVPGIGFDVADDGRQVVVHGESLVLLPASSEPVTLVPGRAGSQIVSASFSPDARAVAMAAQSADDAEVAVVAVAERSVSPVEQAGLVGRPTFSGDGRLLAFNRFGREPDFRSQVLVVAFKG